MQIRELQIRNYKSLRDVELLLGPFSVVIGPNGSGKSNLASAFDFLGDVYQNGLEYAVAKKGGFENIAFRRIRRTKSSIGFAATVVLSPAESNRIMRHPALRNAWQLPKNASLTIRHEFSFRAPRQAIRADYAIENESLRFFTAKSNSIADLLESEVSPSEFLALFREDGKIRAHSPAPKLKEHVDEYLRFFNEFDVDIESSDLFLRRSFSPIAAILGAISVHQFSPQISRAPGSPSPQPRLTSYGANLPSLVDWLQRHHPSRWKTVEASMHDILPELEEISVDYIHTKQLGLFFKERDFARPWAAEDVSDGTIQTLAILSALADPRNLVLFIEEPENSVHPWIVKEIASQLRRVSKQTQVIVTTHSPLIVNVVEPSSVWVCFKRNGETTIRWLPSLSSNLVGDWEKGVDRLFELIDTGAVPEAVPVTSEGG